ncbi:NAD(P)H-binding protein [Lactobacillus acidophilus]|uniref:NAD(P)-dependent oxidoreductase n=1 Tax=Lactobacillus acidophilus TaxID=1579 RepID=UPI001F0A563F|nr:NAD(P)H-binding protein [Lactobacillus acidophilus]MBN3488327.1 NAD(P)H-binding protein [Lactobacillus acidophilus]
MKVGVIGASEMAGSAIYKLAKQNLEIDVTGIVRHESKAKKVLGDDAKLIVGDIFALSDNILDKFDVIIDAFGTDPKNAEEHVILAKKLINLVRKNKIRVIFILGAGSLHTGDDEHLVVDDIAQMDNADTWINTPRQQLKELEYLNSIDDVDWLGISPTLQFEAGPATEYIEGTDELLYNKDGDSKLTSGTMATVVIKETVDSVHHQERITIANA